MQVHTKSLRRRERWYLDSGCSRHMTWDINNFVTLSRNHEGGTITFGDDSKGKIIGIGNIKIDSSSLIENVILVNGLCWHSKKDKIPSWHGQCLTCWHLQKTSGRQADDQFITHLKGTYQQLGLYWSSEADSKPRKAPDRSRDIKLAQHLVPARAHKISLAWEAKVA